MISELKCIYDKRRSFGGKAWVNKDEYGNIILLSYETVVAGIYNDEAVLHTDSLTQTSMRHIKEFLTQNGFFAENTKQVIAEYYKKEE